MYTAPKRGPRWSQRSDATLVGLWSIACGKWRLRRWATFPIPQAFVDVVSGRPLRRALASRSARSTPCAREAFVMVHSMWKARRTAFHFFAMKEILVVQE
jgi:hypothetical protein